MFGRKEKPVIILFLSLLIILAGCGAEPPNPEKTVEDFWEKYRAREMEGLEDFFTTEAEMEGIVSGLFPGENGETVDEELDRIFVDSMSLEVKGHEMEEEEATVDAVFSLPDMEYFLEEFFLSSMEKAFSLGMEGASEEEIEEAIFSMMPEILEETPLQSEEYAIPMVLEDNEWKFTQNPFPDLEPEEDWDPEF